MNNAPTDYNTNSFTEWYEEKTNVHVEWTQVSKNDASKKLNLLLASEDYPDVIFGGNISNAQQLLYGQQGIFIPINEMIEKYGVNIKKILEEYPIVAKDLVLPDGNIYNLPIINECYHATSSKKMWIYTPWLEKLGLNMPTTTEEFYNVLKAFKEKDPNGNKKQDEIPLVGATDGFNTDIDGFIMNAFIYNDNGQNNVRPRLIIKDGKVDAVYDNPEWREGLRYLHKLYAEGLIASESFTQDKQQLKHPEKM